MRRDFMSVNIQKTTAEIDLMDNKKMYVVKDGQLIEHDLPEYGETLVITLGGKVDRLETKTKRKI
ncbi:XtrA/YqaO family protein [Priestia flexa]|uniref:XtrA/YqaO family protein n=1 Tax=Priestia flexa TaxID=86664 RepID=UPI0038514754